ncbi:MAG: hypothetical protein ACFB13_11360 [Kiloniellaceae bacterium]
MAKIAAACALGLLTGLLVGLSTAGVTASVVSAALAMAAGVMALTGITNPFLPKGENAAARSAGHDWAVFCFAVVTVAGLGGGLWMRTHDTLSPTPGELVARWQAAGFEAAEARRIVTAQLGAAAGGGDGMGPALVKTATVLFSGDAATCQRTDPARAPDAAEARNAWSLAPDPWPALAKNLADQPKAGLQAVWTGLCGDVK